MITRTWQTVRPRRRGPGPAGGTGASAPPVAIGMFASKSDLDSIAASGSHWSGTGELYTVAVDWYRNFTINTSTITLNTDSDSIGGQNMRKVLAAAIVFARLKPANGLTDPVVDETAPSFTCDDLRAKIADAIETVIGQANSAGTPDTRPHRHLGGWVLIADLINLPAYDSALNSTALNGAGTNTGFKGWCDYCLAFEFGGFAADEARGRILGNKGIMALWSTIAVECYKLGSLGSSTMLSRMADINKRRMGDTTIATVEGEYSAGTPASLFHGPSANTQIDTWHVTPPSDPTERIGVMPLNATKDGNNLDGLQSDQHRGYYLDGDGTGGADSDPSSYRSDYFPSRYDDVVYNELCLYGNLGLALILYRCGYTDVLTLQNSALERTAEWIHWAYTNHAAKGYEYLGETGGNPFEAAKPLLKYLYPSSTLPTTKVRTSESGSHSGYGWTYWLFDGRSV